MPLTGSPTPPRLGAGVHDQQGLLWQLLHRVEGPVAQHGQKGVFPALWFYASQLLAPSNKVTAEIDLLEMYGASNTFYIYLR